MVSFSKRKKNRITKRSFSCSQVQLREGELKRERRKVKEGGSEYAPFNSRSGTIKPRGAAATLYCYSGPSPTRGYSSKGIVWRGPLIGETRLQQRYWHYVPLVLHENKNKV